MLECNFDTWRQKHALQLRKWLRSNNSAAQRRKYILLENICNLKKVGHGIPVIFGKTLVHIGLFLSFSIL
jgi:hypothetical protein